MTIREKITTRVKTAAKTHTKRLAARGLRYAADRLEENPADWPPHKPKYDDHEAWYLDIGDDTFGPFSDWDEALMVSGFVTPRVGVVMEISPPRSYGTGEMAASVADGRRLPYPTISAWLKAGNKLSKDNALAMIARSEFPRLTLDNVVKKGLGTFKRTHDFLAVFQELRSGAPKNNPELPRGSVSRERAMRLADAVGVVLEDERDLAEFARGLEVEYEHADTVSGKWVVVASIVADHLREDSRYYTRHGL